MQDYLWNKHMAAVKWLCTVVVLQHHFILLQLDSADHLISLEIHKTHATHNTNTTILVGTTGLPTCGKTHMCTYISLLVAGSCDTIREHT
jgi:hypothetical protein